MPKPQSLPWPLPNVWLGTSVEDQTEASRRIYWLQKCPAAVRFLSCEPLISDLRLRTGIYQNVDGNYGGTSLDGIHWVIVGGESGPRARPCNVAWIRSIVGQCKAAGVACFVKQAGSRPMMREDSIEGRRAGDHPEREWPTGTHFGTAPGTERTQWHGRYVILRDRKGGDPSEWPSDLRVREFPITGANHVS